MSKVFRDFEKISHMKKNAMIGIVIGGIVMMMIVGIALTFNQESKTAEADDMFNEEPTKNEESSSEMQARWDEIEKIKLEEYYSEKERQWITSGPFQIDRTEYDLGEKIFLVIEGLKPEEKGQIAFLRQLNDTHFSVYQTIPFDGERKSEFNYYMQPKLSIAKGLCSPEDIVGNWAVVFKGTDHKSITFKITDKIIPNINENYQQPVC
jgi:hypothetical protein